jgi:nucleoside-diphosphate-sugar epimerase
VTIGELADLVAARAARPLARRSLPRRAGDVTRSVLSARRLRGLGWHPAVDLPAGIAELLGPGPG